MYPDSFILQVPPREPHPTAYILDGMFIINIIPLSIHKSFSDYASFLFDKWIVRPHHLFNSTEVHLICDHPNRKGVSTNDLERSRRDVDAQVFEYDHISPDSILPSNWVTFLSVRKHERLFVNFISDQILSFSKYKFPKL